MSYTFNSLSNGNVEVYQDGSRISTGTAQNAQQMYGYTGTVAPAPTAYDTTQVAGNSIAVGATNTNTTPNYSASPYSSTYTAPTIATPPPPAPPPTPTISTASVAPTAPQNFTQPTTSPYYPVSTLATPTSPSFSLSPDQQSAQDLNKNLQDLNNIEAGKAGYQTQQNTAFGVDTASKSIQDLTTQLNGIKNEAAAIPLQLQQGAADRGVTTPMLGAQENSRLRTNAIAALGVSTLLNAAQGNLATAQAMADRAVADKYGPIEAQITAGMKNLQLIMNSPSYTQAEKQQAYQQQLALQQQSNTIAQQKLDYSNILKISTDAASNIQNFQANGQYQTATQALQAMSQAQTPEQALQIAASTGLTNGATAANGTKVLGSATTGYYSYNPSTGTVSPIEKPGTSSGVYQAGQLTTLLQSQGKTADDATLQSLWSQYGTGGTYTNDTAHNAVIYKAMGGQVIAPTSTTSSTSSGSMTAIPSTQVTALKNALNESKFQGAEADGQYADPNLYLANYTSWINAGGDAATFFKYFPPKTYINPTNTFLPPEIMRFVTS